MNKTLAPNPDLHQMLLKLLRDSVQIQHGLDSAKSRILEKNPRAFDESIKDNENL